ncbi:TPA: sensor histidine kinase [Candidatus Nomurabacteria bacterium]|nr:MAG: PAS/PAC sensor signal transduction histidine kinase [Parcubacteria bacterium RAAC4_OD1_1]HCY26295.1 sensor histidine kinase [Candidatus Nomurabacteria bacterium]
MEEEIKKLKEECEKLKQTNEVKSDLISISAHQLRTSLSALKWILKMFLDEDLGKLTSEQNSFIRKAYNSNERMNALVNDLLTLSHAEDTSMSYKFEKIDLLYLIEQTVFDFSGETNKKNIELMFLKPDSPILPINCDKEMIIVVIQNLIENAIKYSNEGGKVFISLKQEENNLIVSVRDTGIGIKEEDKENIFKKFYRAPNAIEKEIIGSGLGLFATKNIVERHKGKIWFDSTEGKGATFFVSLPIN